MSEESDGRIERAAAEAAPQKQTKEFMGPDHGRVGQASLRRCSIPSRFGSAEHTRPFDGSGELRGVVL